MKASLRLMELANLPNLAAYRGQLESLAADVSALERQAHDAELKAEWFRQRANDATRSNRLKGSGEVGY